MTATTLTSKSIRLDWSVPSVLNGGTISGYKIERSLDNANWSVLVANTASTSITYTNTGLTSEQVYYYRVYTITQYGTGPAGNTASTMASDVPDTVTGLDATPITGYRASLSWTAPYSSGNTITSYTVQRSSNNGSTWSTIATPTTTSYIDVPNVNTPTSYTYRVYATNALGSGSPSTSSTLLVGDIPNQVAGLTITPSVGGELGLTWTIPTSNGYSITSYEIQRSTDQTNWTTLSAQTNSYIDTGLNVGTIYYYKVKAINVIGQGSFSTVASKMAGDIPGSPGLTLTTISDTKIKLDYNLSSYNLAQYPILGYKIQVSTDAQNWTTLVENTQAKTYTATGLTPLTEYTFRVAVINALGVGNYATSSISTFGPPSQITEITSSSTGTSNTITWVAPFNGGASMTYKVEVRPPNGQFGLLTTTSLLTYTQINTSYNTVYEYRVTAQNVYGSATPVTISVLSNPSAPSGFKATVVSGTQVNLTWSHISNFNSQVNSYNIYSSADGSTYTLLQSGITTNSYQVTGLNQGQTVFFKISATSENAEGVKSAGIFATTFTIPGIPGSYSLINPNPTSVKLSWVKPSSGGDPVLLTYQIYRSTNNVDFTQLSTTTSLYYIDSGLSSSSSYYYKVRAVNNAGSGSFTTVLSYNTGQLPNAPTNLSLTVTGSTYTAIKLQWNAPASVEYPVIAYKVERAVNGGNWETIVQNSGNALTTMTNSGLSQGSTYSYRVYAINTFGLSPASNTATLKLSSTSVTITGDALLGNTVSVTGSVTANNAQGLSVTNIYLYQNDAKVNQKSVNISLESGTAQLGELSAYPTTQSNFYMTVKLSNGQIIKSNTISLTPTSPYQGEILLSETRVSNYTESQFNLYAQPANFDVVVKYQPKDPTLSPKFFRYNNIPTNLTQTIPVKNTSDYYISAYLNPLSFSTSTINGTQVNIVCNDNTKGGCTQGQILEDIPAGVKSDAVVRSTGDRAGPQLLGIEGLGNLFGLPMVFLFIIGLGAVFTPRTAQMGVVFILAGMGMLWYLGYLSFDYTAGANVATWAIMIILMVLGLFIGKRWD